VSVINAGKIKVTGNKLSDKIFFWHTGYIGGIKERTMGETLAGSHPERLLEKAVQRMISRNVLGRQQFKNLRVYAGAEHPHAAQNPIVLDVAAMNSKNKR
jgi:large subunit ribosomal protein L13